MPTPPKPITEKGTMLRCQGQTRQAGQLHGSIVRCILAVPGPEPWQSCRIASISGGRSCSRHAQKLNPCPPPAAPRSTSPASYCIHLLPRPSIFPRSALPCLLLLLPASRSCIFRHRSTTASSTTIHQATVYTTKARQPHNHYYCIGTCFRQRQNSATNPRLGQPPAACVVLTRDVSTRPVA